MGFLGSTVKIQPKKRTIVLFLLSSLLTTYVILYYNGVSPDGEVDTDARIVLYQGWSARYPPYQNYRYTERGMAWNRFVNRFFTPIHQVDRMLRRDLWLSAKEKQDKIYRATRVWQLKAPLQDRATPFL